MTSSKTLPATTKEIWDELTDAELEFVTGGAAKDTLENTSDYGGCCCEGGYTHTDEPPGCCCAGEDDRVAGTSAFDVAKG